MGIGEVAEPKAKLKTKVEIMDESLIEKQNGNFANTVLPAVVVQKSIPLFIATHRGFVGKG